MGGLVGVGWFRKDLTARVRVATITDMTTTKGHTMELFENTHSGSIVCRQHLGMEATARFEAKPTAKSVKTAFGTIRKMSEADAQGWIEYVGDRYINGCESCK